MARHNDTQDGTDADDGTVRKQFDWAATRPAVGVIETLTEATGTDPLTGEVLFEYVDTDALDTLLEPGTGEENGTALTVSFTIEDWHVVVGSDGYVVVTSNGHAP